MDWRAKRSEIWNMNIRLTNPEDAHLLPVIEGSAAESFRIFPDLAWIADDENMPAETHLKYVAQGTSWVAEAEDQLIGFLSAESVGEDLHIWELAVRQEWQGQGIGQKLMKTALDYARNKKFKAVTLTTFRDVPWNEPFYRSLGFELINEENMEPRLKQILLAEIEQGLPGAQRCAMKLLISSKHKSQ